MEPQDRAGLARFAREHHVHYEVEPETVAAGERPGLVGFEVRLFATHAQPRLEAPTCPRCVELLGELRTFADGLVRLADAADRTEIASDATPALYESTEVPGADEIALMVRVRGDPQASGAAAEERCLGPIRERLHELGVPRR
jgi:hypothetical protein